MEMESAPGFSRREWGFVAFCTLVGAVLRIWGFGQLGLQHFDEGIYAIAGLWGQLPGGFADVGELLIPYAPPGFPLLVGLSYLVFGAMDRAAILVSIIAGTATVPVAAWIARRTFGTGAGAAAAALVALSGMHIAYSRVALTDATFLLVWLIALGVGGWFLERPRAGRAVLFGLCVGLAQNFKYNGALTGLIVALAVVLDLVLDPERSRHAPRRIALLVLAGVVSALVYLPWFLYVESHGGYAGLLAHHRGYSYGLTGWVARWRLQLAQENALSGLIHDHGSVRMVGFLLAWIGAEFAARTLSDLGPVLRWVVRLSLGTIWLVCGSGAMPWLVGLGALPWLVTAPRPTQRLLAVWWVVMTLITPLYHPYSRLWLPLVGSTWLIVAGAMVGLARRLAELDAARGPSLRLRPDLSRAGVGAALVLLASIPLALGPVPGPPRPGLWAPTASLESQLIFHTASLPPMQTRPLLVLARPTARFYLANGATNRPFLIMPDVDRLLQQPDSDAGALIDEAILSQEADPAAARARLFARYEPVAGRDWDETLGLVPWLDLRPQGAYRRAERREVHWWFLRSRSAP